MYDKRLKINRLGVMIFSNFGASKIKVKYKL